MRIFILPGSFSYSKLDIESGSIDRLGSDCKEDTFFVFAVKSWLRFQYAASLMH